LGLRLFHRPSIGAQDGDVEGLFIAEIRHRTNTNFSPGHTAEALPQLAADGGVRGSTPFLQLHVDLAFVDGAEQTGADGGVGEFDRGVFLEDLFNAIRLDPGGFQCRAGFGLEAHLEIATVEIGHEVLA